MLCPPPVVEILLQMLRTGLLACRTAAWEKQPWRCAIEADHLHNIPDLLQNYAPELLEYYWNVERPAFIAQVGEDHLSCWQPLWHRLEPHVRPVGEPAPAP